jgi:HEAT repeat protein
MNLKTSSLLLFVLLLAAAAEAENPLKPEDVRALARMAQDSTKADEPRIAALWTLGNVGALRPEMLAPVLQDKSAAVRRNALQIIAEKGVTVPMGSLIGLLKDADARVRFYCLAALSASPVVTTEGVRAAVAAYPDLKDPWLESAAVGVAAKAPVRREQYRQQQQFLLPPSQR